MKSGNRYLAEFETVFFEVGDTLQNNECGGLMFDVVGVDQNKALLKLSSYIPMDIVPIKVGNFFDKVDFDNLFNITQRLPTAYKLLKVEYYEKE